MVCVAMYIQPCLNFRHSPLPIKTKFHHMPPPPFLITTKLRHTLPLITSKRNYYLKWHTNEGSPQNYANVIQHCKFICVRNLPPRPCCICKCFGHRFINISIIDIIFSVTIGKKTGDLIPRPTLFGVQIRMHICCFSKHRKSKRMEVPIFQKSMSPLFRNHV